MYSRPHLIRLELFSYYSNAKWVLSEPLYIMRAPEDVTALWLRDKTYNLLYAKRISTEQCPSFGDNRKIPLSHKNRRKFNFLRDLFILHNGMPKHKLKTKGINHELSL